MKETNGLRTTAACAPMLMALGLAVLALSACTGGATAAPETSSASSAVPGVVPGQETTAPSSELTLGQSAPAEKELALGRSASPGGATLGPFSTGTGYLAIDFQCRGKGIGTVKLSDGSGASMDCGVVGDGMRSTLTVQSSRSLTATVSSPGAWVVRISQVPPADPGPAPSS
ncbi:hypothetical protein [Arthrobacter sp. NPDC090010]|uniref:hypothetical protein n=1 Tax=Arthrobacter sp. NPDC090010 TaxID=3363942 RepID=UPI0037F9CF4A